MRICRLDLLAYGSFTDQTLSFGDGPGGVTLVYGENEAGKSVALRAISGWLFGIGAKTPDDFVHTYKKLLIGGVVANEQGDKLHFHRRKANKNSLLNPDADSQPYPDTVLAPFLHGIDGPRFDQVYSIDHAKLEAGGKQLQQLKGLAGESLFAASMGITGLNSLLKALESEADELFRMDRRSKSAIRKAMRERDEAGKAKRAAECSAANWDKLGRELRKAKQNHEDVKQKLEQLRANHAQLERTMSVLGELGQRQALEQGLADGADVRILPEEYDREARHKAEHTLDRAGRQIETKQARLDDDDGLRAKLDRLDVPEDLLSQAETIETLHANLGAYRNSSQDLPKRQAEKGVLETEVARVARDLDIENQADGLGSVRLTAEREARIRDLIQRRASLEQDLDAGAKRRARLTRKLDTARDELAKMPGEKDTRALRLAVEAARKEGELSRLLASEEGASRSLDHEVDAKLAALGYWSGAADQIEQLALPLRATLDSHADRFKDLTDERARRDEMERECADAISEADKSIARLERDQRVPTEQTLGDARKHRDHGWSLVKSAWLDEQSDEQATAAFCGEQELPDAYERAVVGADEVSDRLRGEAEAVLKLQLLQDRIADQQAEIERLEHTEPELSRREKESDERWRELWHAVDVPEPGSAREMVEWLERFEDLRRAAAEQRRAKGRRDDLRAAIDRHVESLGAAERDLGAASPADDESLDALLERCAAIVERTAEQRQVRLGREKRIAELEEDLEDCDREISGSEDDLAPLQTSWDEAVKALGANADVSTAEVNARMAELRNLVTCLGDSDKLGHRIKGMQDQIDNFEMDVRSVVERCAPDLAQQPAAQALGELSSRLKQAGRDQTRREELKKQIAQLDADIADLNTEKNDAEATLAELCRLAAVESPEALKEAEQSSGRRRSAQEKLEEIDKRLLRIGRGTGIQTLIEEAADKDGNSIRAELDGLQDEIKSLEGARDDLAAKTRGCQQACDDVDGSAAAAEADERALASLGHIRDLADRFVRVRLAATLLRQRIEAHRAETQDPMLERASALLSKLTCGFFSGLTIAYDDKDQPVIVGRRASNGENVPVEGFSDGTADQLYLALRLAYLERSSDGTEPMPLIVDDILVDFDDRRARATFEVLGDLATKTQVIVFTHHEHLIDLIEDTLPEGLRFVQRLPGP